MVKTSRIMLLLLVLGLMTSQSQAGVTTFIGEDLQPTANSTVRTNSDAMAAAFGVAAQSLGQVGTITFEAAPLGSFTNLTVALGVSINGNDINGNAQTIRNTTNFPSYPSVDGSNTTAGGSNFVEMVGGTLTFTFVSPTRFFGIYLTGVQTNFFADKVTFNDGTAESITLQGAGTSSSEGETAFIGFTTTGTPVTSITITAGSPNSADDIGVDDVRYQVAGAAAPESSSLALLLPALGAVGMALRIQRQRRK